MRIISKIKQGVTAAKKDWADSRRFYGILPPSKKSLLLKENQILVTDFQAPVSGFRNGYRKEMAKLKFKSNVIKSATTGCLGSLFIYYLFYLSIPEIQTQAFSSTYFSQPEKVNGGRVC